MSRPPGAGVGFSARPVALTLSWVLVGSSLAAPAGSYSFRDADYRVVRPEDAPKWGPEDRTLRFRLLANENDRDFPIDGGTWQEAAASAIEAWNAVSTSGIRLILEEAVVERDWGSGGDGLNTIGISSYPPLASSFFPYAINSANIAGGLITGCDIEVNARAPAALSEGRRFSLAWLEAQILHQIGHCLGLAHSEPFPESVRNLPEIEGDGDGEGPVFAPDPVMSEGYIRTLTADDIAGVSALYPAPGFAASRGAVTGELVFPDGAPAAHAYVQTLVAEDGGASPGPGAFADSEGRFLVEGLLPGPVMLVIHPILLRFSHEFRSRNFVLDQWRFVEVGAGAVSESEGSPIRTASRFAP